MREELVLSSLGHTWILDLDGTLVKYNGYKEGGDVLLPGVKEFFENLPDGDMVVIVTARKEEFREQTENFLLKNGVCFDHIIFEAPYGERILINDRKPSGLAMSVAVNTDRDEDWMVDVQIDKKL